MVIRSAPIALHHATLLREILAALIDANLCDVLMKALLRKLRGLQWKEERPEYGLVPCIPGTGKIF